MTQKPNRRGPAAPSLAWAPLQAFVIFGFIAAIWAILA
jgi:hypothetical protein